MTLIKDIWHDIIRNIMLQDVEREITGPFVYCLTHLKFSTYWKLANVILCFKYDNRLID